MAHQEHHQNEAHHHIVPTRVLLGVGGSLLFLTFITVAVAHVDLGHLNFVVAMAIASLKASLVALIFMNLWYDKKENGVIFATSFLFLAIFIVLTSTDLFFRGDVYVKGPLTTQAKSKLKNPWISTPGLVAHGKELFSVNCVACHGAEGQGNGPAAAALNPPPRNFTQTAGWKNGRKPSMIFKTLKEGIPGGAMASFGTLPPDDRWALTAYVLTLNPTAPEKDSAEDFKKAGVDPNGGGEAEEKVIPVELAMERISVPEGQPAHLYAASASAPETQEGLSAGARTYQAQCIQCHGAHGEGGIKVRNLGVWPVAFVTTRKFSSYSAMKSTESFNSVVVKGLPGEVMPGNGQLNSGELRELYQYIQGL